MDSPVLILTDLNSPLTLIKQRICEVLLSLGLWVMSSVICCDLLHDVCWAKKAFIHDSYFIWKEACVLSALWHFVPVFISVQQMAALNLIKQPFEPALKTIARAQTQLK